MKFEWIITRQNSRPYLNFVEENRHLELVRTRNEANVKRKDVVISKERFWKKLVGCLLTTQQRSGPDSTISRFINNDGDLFDINFCLRHAKLADYSRRKIAAAGIRRNVQIGKEIAAAANWFKEHEWPELKQVLEPMRHYTTAGKERSAARYLQENFVGLGPKQSRNLLQWMGLTRYEIPIDSRVVKVLRELRFPAPLSSKALSDEDYYCFIEDGLQTLLASIDIYPCIFDACAFASRDAPAEVDDEDDWDEDV